MAEPLKLFDLSRLYSPAYIRDVLKIHNLILKKSLGQNFLFDRNAIEKIIRTADISSDDVVLEIGPGMGHLTAALLNHARHVVAVEIDQRMVHIIKGLLGNNPNLSLVQADILKVHLAQRFKELGLQPAKLVANVPYYITTPIFLHLLESGIPFRNATFTVQKELAERFVAEPGSREYRAVSVFIRYWGVPRICGTIPATCFFPRPHVDSSILSISMHDIPPVGIPDKPFFFKVVRMAFSTRRKKLHNSLAPLDKEGYPLDAALEQAGIDGTIRPENLALEDFARLTEALILQAARQI